MDKLTSTFRIPHDANVLIISENAESIKNNIKISRKIDTFNSYNELELNDVIIKYHIIIIDSIHEKDVSFFIQYIIPYAVSLARIYSIDNTFILNRNLHLVSEYESGKYFVNEYWVIDGKSNVVPFLIISPIFSDIEKVVLKDLQEIISNNICSQKICYTENLVSKFYSTTPWFIELKDFFNKEEIYNREAILLTFEGASYNELIKLIDYKRKCRSKFGEIKGEKSKNGYRGMILPFHIPEPHEIEDVFEYIKGECFNYKIDDGE